MLSEMWYELPADIDNSSEMLNIRCKSISIPAFHAVICNHIENFLKYAYFHTPMFKETFDHKAIYGQWD